MWHPLKAAVFGCLIGIAGLLASLLHFSHDIEESVGLGLLFNLRGPREAPSDVIVISIDRKSSERLKVSSNPDRWPRSLHADLIKLLISEGAASIIFDMYFIDPRTPTEDDSLATAINNAGNVVLAELLRAQEVSTLLDGGVQSTVHRVVSAVKPIESVAQAAFATAPFVLPRMPVRVNQYWTFLPDAGDSPTFPVVALQLYTLPVHGDFIRLLKRVRPFLADRLPDDAKAAFRAGGAVRFIKSTRNVFEGDPLLGEDMIRELEQSKLADNDPHRRRMLKALINMYGGSKHPYLNYYGPPQTLATIPFHEALWLGADTADVQRPAVAGKVVFVGLSEKELAERQDSFHTVFSQANGVFISGVEIAATAFANLVEGRPVTPIGARAYLALILAWGFLVGAICRMTVTTVAALAVTALSAVYLVVAHFQFTNDGTWLPVAIPLFLQGPLGFFGALSLNYFETNRERQNIRNALSYYVPTEVVNQLARNRIDMRRGGETVFGVCLFADAAGYTPFAERFEPQQLREVMHQYFEATFAPIRQNGGLVIDLKGDSILAIWKGAQPEAELRQEACHAALGLAKAVREFNQRMETLQLPTRIGLHAGELFLGNIGAGEHYEYGVTGDTVNTASRMDGLNKYLGTQILVSAEVIHELKGFLAREAGSFLLKGKTQPVVVYELLCRLEEATEKQKQASAIFTDALVAFRQRAWGEARTNFDRCIDLLGEDGLSQFYLKHCEQYLNHPPDKPWTGVIEMEEK